MLSKSNLVTGINSNAMQGRQPSRREQSVAVVIIDDITDIDDVVELMNS